MDACTVNRRQVRGEMEQLRDAQKKAETDDIHGFASLVERFQDMAVGYCYSILGDFHLAQDASQEAFVEAYPNLHKVYAPEAFPAWFRRILFKHCDRMLRRKTLKAIQLDEANSVAATEGTPESIAESRELEAELRDAINSLPPTVRSAITLFYISDYSQKEICEFLDIPATTLKSRLYRGRKLLRERMTEMVTDNLRRHRPSRDESFAAGIWRGLRGVYVDRTEVSSIDGDRGRLFYRGYSIDSLAEHSTFEEVCYLMLFGVLPTRAQLERLDADLRSARTISYKAIDLLRGMTQMPSIDALRTVVSAMGGADTEAVDNSRQATIRRGIRITASTPTILAAHYRMRKGWETVAPRADLGHAANFLHMLFGKPP